MFLHISCWVCRFLLALTRTRGAYYDMVNEDGAKAMKAERINEGRISWDELDEEEILLFL